MDGLVTEEEKRTFDNFDSMFHTIISVGQLLRDAARNKQQFTIAIAKEQDGSSRVEINIEAREL